MSHNIGINPFFISGLLTVITCFTLLVINLKNAHTQIHRTWAFFNFSITIWGFGTIFFSTASDPAEALMWWKISFIGVIFIAVTFFHTAWLFCNLKDNRPLYFVYIQGIFFLIALHSDYFFKGVELIFEDSYPFYFAQAGPLYHPFLAIWLSLITYGHYKIIKEYQKARGIKKVQSKYFFIGMFTGFLGGTSNFFPAYGINFFPYGNFFIPIYSLVITYAIFRYRLLDINIVIARFTIFIILFLLSLSIPFIVFFNKVDYLIEVFKNKNLFLLFVIFTSAIISTILNFVYLFVQSKAENKLLMNQRQQHQTLLHLSRNMTLLKDLDELSDLIVNTIVDSAEIDYCAVYLSINQKNYKLVKQKPSLVPNENTITRTSPLVHKMVSSKHILIKEELEIKGESPVLIPIMEHLKASVISPAFIKENLLGCIIIGTKISGMPYTDDDLGIFSTISNNAALAIENALFFQELEKTQTELFQAAKMSSLGTLASGMGHQINNRLQAISSLVEFVKIFHSDNLDETASDSLQKALENVEQGKNIIQTLREHARPSTEGYTSISLKSVLDKSIEMVKLKKGSKFDAVAVKTNVTDDSLHVIGNKSQLQEVFFNLFDNADDALTEASQAFYKNNDYHPQIRVDVTYPDDKRYMDIAVKDNGIGMAEENLKKLFVPFHTTKATSQKGTGLGLYVIDKIIKGHGGKVNVTSQYGKGTTFMIQLKKGAK